MIGRSGQAAIVVGAVAMVTWALARPPASAEQDGGGKSAPLPAGAVRQLGEVRFPNVGHTLGVAFSPDGKTLAAGSWDDTVRLWDVATGKEVRQLTGHKSYVKGVAYSRDGKTLLTYGGDRTFRVWDAATGQTLQVIKTPLPVDECALAPDGKLLTAHVGKHLILWDLATGKELYRQPTPHPDTAVGFTPDGKEVICLAYREGTWIILFRDAVSGKELRELATGLRSRFDNALSLNGRMMLLSRGETIHLYDLVALKLRKAAKVAERAVERLAFSTHNKMFASFGQDEFIYVWETATFQERCRFRGFEAAPPLAFSPDGTLLASGSTDSTVLLWDVPGIRTGKAAAKLTAKDLDTLWDELASSEAARGFGAMGKLLAQPEVALPYLKDKVRPVTATVDPAVLDQLLEDLASEKYAVRNQATLDLGKHGELAEPALRKALDKKSTLEVRQRVEKLLARLEEERVNPAPERLRIMRAVEILESLGSPAAVELLETWAKGTPGVLLTREAREALENLAARKRLPG